MNLAITPCKWSDAARADLARAAGTVDDGGGIDALAAEVARGDALLFALSLEMTGDAGVSCNAPVGHFAVRVERDAGGKELVIVAAGGRLTGARLTDLVTPAIEEMGRRFGARSVRVHTARRGLVRLLTAAHGYRETERVLRKRLAA